MYKNLDARDIGFIAQELQIVIPEVVIGRNDDILRVKYHDIVALCIEAIKEQSKILENASEQLEILERITKEKGLN